MKENLLTQGRTRIERPAWNAAVAYVSFEDVPRSIRAA